MMRGTDYTLIPASMEYREVVQNLMQFYIYDFSEYIHCDVEKDGLFIAYPHLEEYWKVDNQRFPYIIKKDERFIGFVFVRFIESAMRSHFSIAEFFIMRKYRRKGIGSSAAKEIFDLHKGPWEIYQKENNKPAQAFWIKIISEYTKGEFTEHEENGRRIQNFEN
jgi:predicted acetyltransferase